MPILATIFEKSYMSVLGKIRERTALLLIVIVGGVVLFLVQDAFNSSSNIFGDNQNSIGEIYGEEIDRTDYELALAEADRNFKINQGGKSPNEMENRRIQGEAWNKLIFNNAYKKQMEELGILVTEGEDGEEVDMVQGITIHQSVKQQFSNPQTKEFDVNQVKTFLSQIADPQDQQVAMAKAQWLVYRDNLIQDRLRGKYVDLISKTNYVTKAEAKRRYEEQNSKADIEVVYIPFTAVKDSLEYSNEDINEYLNEYGYKYDPKPSKTLAYVVFDAQPTSEDTSEVKANIEKIIPNFKKVKNDTSYVFAKADNPRVPSLVSEASLPYSLKRDSTEIVAGEVYGPYKEGNAFKLYKVSEILKNDSIFKAQASHILIPTPQGAGEEAAMEARIQAQTVLDLALSGEDFGNLAQQYSQDPGSKVKGGDLGEFGKGQMVPPFENAVFSAQKEGVVPQVVQSQFGFHIIKVTKKKFLESVEDKYRIAILDKTIEPSKSTRDQAYREANIFLNSSENLADLKAKAEEKGYKVEEAKNVGSSAYGFGRFYSDGRQMVRWAYTEAEIGQVAETVYNVDNSYVILGLESETVEDELTAENLSGSIANDVENYLKSKKVVPFLAGRNEDVKAMKEAAIANYGENTASYTSESVKLFDANIPAVGNANEVIGTAFGQKEGEISGVVNNGFGAARIKTVKVYPAPETENLEATKTKLEQEFGQKDNYLIDQAVQEDAEIEDFRIKFF